MTLREKMVAMCVDCGMFPTMADRCLTWIIEQDLIMERARWPDLADGYPTALHATLWMAVRRQAVEWIDANLPDARFRPMFDDAQMEEIFAAQTGAVPTPLPAGTGQSGSKGSAPDKMQKG